MSEEKKHIIERLMDNPQHGDLNEAAELISTQRILIEDLTTRIGEASILLADWDGYYDPETRKGNAVELAKLVEDAFCILQGRSWRSAEEKEAIQAQGGE